MDFSFARELDCRIRCYFRAIEAGHENNKEYGWSTQWSGRQCGGYVLSGWASAGKYGAYDWSRLVLEWKLQTSY